ncbi:hypothetical protein OB955_21580 [Halobacteria archaeon AArc-m2/3/4]|uniref:Uncharacterized protein n=1 Tax=Natronoglomus mannanivorans TaxID=2979990 RepID=A0AAP3E2E4_9EURY|nr:hypothetical protein [Halobacteria archaeon AArc-xg1-1]MCU4975297.1 hypothetical protein [Halobacteria archaeon AArc-m2/3/4]
MSLEADGTDEPSVVYENPGPVERFKNSFSLKLAAAGLALIVIGFILQTGVMAAVLAVWGGALVVIGIGMYAFIQWSLQGTQG